MSKLTVEVCRVEEVVKHPNAERLSIVKVKGWNCIVGLNQYSVGELVCFVPPDCIIPKEIIEKYDLQYLKNGRTSTLKLRGFVSQGLILNSEEEWKEGQDVSEILKIKKYEVQEPVYAQNKTSTKKRINPLFEKYTDIDNIKNYPNVFSENDNVVMLEKIHGTNARFGNIPIGTNEMGSFLYQIVSWFKKNILKHEFEFVYGSHNVQKSGSDNPQHFYGEDVWGKIAKKYDLANRLPNNLIFYGEIAGEGIQDLTYSLKQHELFIFDVKDVRTGKYLDWHNVLFLCEELGLKTVPSLYEGNYTEDYRKMLTTGKSVIDGKTVREGIVVKPLIEENDRKIGRKILKSVSEEYLLRKNGTEFK